MGTVAGFDDVGEPVAIGAGGGIFVGGDDFNLARDVGDGGFGEEGGVGVDVGNHDFESLGGVEEFHVALDVQAIALVLGDGPGSGAKFELVARFPSVVEVQGDRPENHHQDDDANHNAESYVDRHDSCLASTIRKTPLVIP